MAREHQIFLNGPAMGDLLQRLLDAEASRVGEPAGRILLIVRPGREAALAEATHAFGLVDTDLLFFLGADEDERVVRRLHRVGEAARIPFARMGQIALGYPIILLGADADVELEMMVSDRFLGEGDLTLAACFEIAQERVADSG